MSPSFQEALISQIPALRLLQQLGFTYLSPEECAVERNGRLGRVILEKVLAGQLRRLNRISFKGREVGFTEENIAKGIEALRHIPFEGLVRTSGKKIFKLSELMHEKIIIPNNLKEKLQIAAIRYAADRQLSLIKDQRKALAQQSEA